MSTTLTRRKFIEVGLALGAGLAAGSCTHLFDRPASQKVTVTVVADAFAYYPSEPDPGFCLHVEAVTGGLPYGLLFDCGIQGPRLLDALHRCGIGPESINAVVLSHGHSDHAQGSLSVLEFLNQLESKIPIYVTSGVFGDQRAAGTPGSIPVGARRAENRDPAGHLCNRPASWRRFRLGRIR